MKRLCWIIPVGPKSNHKNPCKSEAEGCATWRSWKRQGTDFPPVPLEGAEPADRLIWV